MITAFGGWRVGVNVRLNINITSHTWSWYLTTHIVTAFDHSYLVTVFGGLVNVRLQIPHMLSRYLTTHRLTVFDHTHGHGGWFLFLFWRRWAEGGGARVKVTLYTMFEGFMSAAERGMFVKDGAKFVVKFSDWGKRCDIGFGNIYVHVIDATEVRRFRLVWGC